MRLGAIQKDIMRHLELAEGRAYFFVGMTGFPGHRWCSKYDESQVRSALERLEHRRLIKGTWGWVEKI